MVLMANKRKASRENPWGYYLESLVSSRHYDNLTQFSEDLHENGRGVSPQMISKYKRQTAPLWFIADSIEVLELDEEETNKYVALWLETLPPDEKAVHEKMAALLLRESTPEPRYPGGAESEQDFEQGLDAEESVRKARRKAGRGGNGTGPGGTSV